TTTSLTRPQVVALDPTPTTGGTVQPVALSRTKPPKKSAIGIAGLVGIGVLASVSALLLLSRSAPKEIPPAPAAHVAPPPAEVAPRRGEVAPPLPQPQPPAPPAPAPEAPAAEAPKPIKRISKSKPAIATSPLVVAPPPVAPEKESGLLSLDTTPWTTVSENGH